MSTRKSIGLFTEKISELQELYLSKNDKLDQALLLNERLEKTIKSLTQTLEETRSQLIKVNQQNENLLSENNDLRHQLKNSQIHNSDLQQFQNAVLSVVNKQSKNNSNHNEQTKNEFGSYRSPKSKHLNRSSFKDTVCILSMFFLLFIFVFLAPNLNGKKLEKEL
ncbi:myotonic dystrophy s/t kinase-related [Anaeramoeba flamelloides]|uniref:Myotonic dystrophy s/t kinase-related n=1 Tax=Anaeramoeba flamelloides TaxID=1746091 RepID=A0ABQ8YFY1_9EUKA|nr:myotonic dystrophy s/t kinase-related [Anaeramoeba flamelloides]